MFGQVGVVPPWRPLSGWSQGLELPPLSSVSIIWVLIEPVVREVRSSLLAWGEIGAPSKLVAHCSASNPVACSGSGLDVGAQGASLVQAGVGRCSWSRHLRLGSHVFLNTAQEDQDGDNEETENKAAHYDDPGAD